MSRTIRIVSIICFILVAISLSEYDAKAEGSKHIILDNQTTNDDLYPYLDMIKDPTREITIEDVVSGEYADNFVQAQLVEQKPGFFEMGNWLRFEVENNSDNRDWFLELGFPLIYEIELYREVDGEIIQLFQGGARTYPFNEREINHRHFVFNLDITPRDTDVFYMMAAGGGDLHPPITIWEQNSFIERTENEYVLLGIFYGIILAMIIYNLFLFFSLRMKSYLYYVIVITFTLLGKLSINGIAFQYLWPNTPEWNIYATPFFVSIACIFILLFTRNFLNIDRYIAVFKYIMYVLVALNATVILSLFFSQYFALYMMLIASFLTFSTVLISAVIALIRGARQARFYILGWLIFLTGVLITILGRAAILPYSTFVSYAGQGALTIEVVLLSLALADKINIMRKEKEELLLARVKTFGRIKTLNEQLVQMNTELEDKVAERTFKLKTANENLQNIVEQRRQLLASIAHELGTPLTLIHHYIQSIQKGLIDIDDPHYSNLVTDKIRVLNRLIDDLFDLSLLESGKISLNTKEIHVYGWLEQIYYKSEFAVLQNKRTFSYERIPDELKNFKSYMDEERLDQLFSNLISNAIENTDKGKGEISMSAHIFDDNQLLIEITDNGDGIAKEDLPYIFERFYRKKSVRIEQFGSGLGLALVKQIIDGHKGSISVESKLNEWTTFYIVLPVVLISGEVG